MRVIRAFARAFILSLVVFVAAGLFFSANGGGFFLEGALSVTGFILVFSVVILEMVFARL